MTTTRVEPPATNRLGRRPELDAIRALVVIGLVFFHSALVFDTRDDYYVKNAETTDATMIIAGLAVVWAMPILFLIAGIGSWHSLHRRGTAGFAAERLRRIGVPLVFATLTIIPVPQWLRLRANPEFHESYLRFLPRFFDVRLEPAQFPFVVQGEYFETGHLWFLVLLLAFSLLLAPATRWLPRDHARQVQHRLAAAARWRGTALLPAVPLAVISALVGLEESFAGWSRWAYLLFFLYGLTLAADERFRAALRRDAPLAAALAPAVLLIGIPGFLAAAEAPSGNPFTDMTALAIGARALYAVAGWCVLVTILGLLDRRRRPAPPTGPRTLHSPGRRLYRYLSEAVLPVYILHQPIVVAVAYHVVDWDAPIPVKYAMIVTVSLALTVTAYDLLVRRTRVTRYLFGMRADAPPRSATVRGAGSAHAAACRADMGRAFGYWPALTWSMRPIRPRYPRRFSPRSGCWWWGTSSFALPSGQRRPRPSTQPHDVSIVGRVSPYGLLVGTPARRSPSETTRTTGRRSCPACCSPCDQCSTVPATAQPIGRPLQSPQRISDEFIRDRAFEA